jgi:hypothetical protein
LHIAQLSLAILDELGHFQEEYFFNLCEAEDVVPLFRQVDSFLCDANRSPQEWDGAACMTNAGRTSWANRREGAEASR